jgi:hypothetical protein
MFCQLMKKGLASRPRNLIKFKVSTEKTVSFIPSFFLVVAEVEKFADARQMNFVGGLLE